MPKVRGAMFLSTLIAVRATRGSEAEAAARGALPPALADALRQGRIARDDWYPVSDVAAMHTAIDSVFGGGEEYAEELGRAATEHDLVGFLGFILSVTSPQLLVRYGDLALRAYFQGVRFETTMLRANHYRLESHGMVGANRLMHATFSAGTCLLLGRTGARNARISRREMTSAGDCLTEFSWDE